MKHLTSEQDYRLIAGAGEQALATRLRNQACMVATVAHELRQPMSLLTLSADLASTDDRTAFERRLDTIREALRTMERLIDDLDDYGCLEAGCLRLVCGLVHPAAIVRSALAAFASIAAARNIRLSSVIDDSAPIIFADRHRLLQVISNLLANATCLTPSGGEVVVSVEHDGDAVRFTVCDGGPGIDLADLPHLFERFWRGAHGRYAGRGLGLSIARGIVESHGGRIWAENQVTHGARISFTVRAAAVDPDARHE